jgi:hypothetical protein
MAAACAAVLCATDTRTPDVSAPCLRAPVAFAGVPAVAVPAMDAGERRYSGEELTAGFVLEQGKPSRQPALSVFQVGEELTYEVGYLLVKLGTIVSRVTGIDTVKGKVYYRTECLMRSYKGVPLVTLWTKFQSTVDQSLGSVSFSAKERYKDTTYKYIHYTYPKNRDVVFVSERIGNKPVPSNYDTLKLDGVRWQDGLSLLFYARAFALQRFTDRVPVLIYRTKATTTINFGVKEEKQEIDAVNYPIRTMKLDGETGFTGIFGLTGGFEGWFSKDWAAVPIYAKMHVIIGSVSVELISWKKNGWTPPR